ncbi:MULTISPECIES: phosphoglycolate phosphatase [Haloferax]|uniref:Phosphoglycolate phosphatase n=1 Tax=Haloferax marinum TaxID=2666143 RepID=A0A6A8G7X0_9EURY|nr:MULTISPECIES: phosphoglycolate phosphatase [Haloferax]KAB1197903.1 phosphoglycolate phosphatase [Haloferax sp. CBA1150]MRW96967.1 phosphoglycolate phosphatase [Haloferax marinum]
MTPPLALDIDGTLTRPDGGIDPRVFDPLREWDAPVIIATGKSFPYPVALCEFIGVPERVIAENGGVVLVDDEATIVGDDAAARRVTEELDEAGYGTGWGDVDTHNRWRETELSVNRTTPLDELEDIATANDQIVVDTGYAYHVKSATVNKGIGLEAACSTLNIDPKSVVAIGDSANDVELFEVAGHAAAVANAADEARNAADYVTENEYADGVLEVLADVRPA